MVKKAIILIALTGFLGSPLAALAGHMSEAEINEKADQLYRNANETVRLRKLREQSESEGCTWTVTGSSTLGLTITTTETSESMADAMAANYANRGYTSSTTKTCS